MGSAYLRLDTMTAQQASAEAIFNKGQDVIDAMIVHLVKSATTTAQPGSPALGDVYILPASPTGTNWTGHAKEIAIYSFYNASWFFVLPVKGMTFYAQDTDTFLTYDGTSWLTTRVNKRVQSGITAFATGGQASATLLTGEYCHVAVCATASDSVKLPVAAKGLHLRLINRGAQLCAVFPNTGNKIDDGAANASINLGVGKANDFDAIDAINWYTLKGA